MELAWQLGTAANQTEETISEIQRALLMAMKDHPPILEDNLFLVLANRFQLLAHPEFSNLVTEGSEFMESYTEAGGNLYRMHQKMARLFA